MRKCTICRESWDDQFITKLETLGNEEKKVVHLCEYCYTDETVFDDEKDMLVLEYGSRKYYPSYLL